jgi:hypothetical protein
VHQNIAFKSVAALVICTGCSDRDEIRSYTIPKETPPAPAVAAGAPAEASGPTGEMQRELPESWSRVANTNPMRFATFTAGEGDGQIEIAVTQLGGVAGGIGANINRWRGQIGLPPASEEELQDSLVPVVTDQAEGLFVDLVGPAASDDDPDTPRMLAAIFPALDSMWFIKTTSTRAAIETHREAFIQLCESVHFAGSGGSAGSRDAAAGMQPAPDAGEPGTLAWDALPEGWTVDATPKPMSVASLTISDGAQQASLTITPLGGQQDLLANINRWRGQLGVSPLSGLEEEPPAAIEVAGEDGHLVDIAGAEARILAVVSTRSGQTWFYKLSGPDPLVAGNKASFEAFIRSIRFEGATGE